jgi:WD40 repeat protein
MVSGSNDTTLRLWDLASRTSRSLEGHTHWVSAVAFALDGRSVVSVSQDGTCRLWDVASAREVARFEGDGPLGRLAVTSDGRMLAAGDSLGSVHVLDILADAADKQTWLARFEGCGSSDLAQGR